MMAPGIVAARRVDPARVGIKQVLEFVWVDLDALRDGALHDLRYDLIVFTVGIGATFQFAPEQLSKPLLRQLQRDLRKGLDTMKAQGLPWPLPEQPGRVTAEPPMISPRGHHMSAGRLSYDLKPFRGAFLTAAAQAIFTHWDEIHRCPQCGSFFLKIRRQKYCSRECRWNAFAPSRSARDWKAEYRSRTRQQRDKAVSARRKEGAR
jgi:hypothetical protein